jgi:hypothetical protein
MGFERQVMAYVPPTPHEWMLSQYGATETARIEDRLRKERSQCPSLPKIEGERLSAVVVIIALIGIFTIGILLIYRVT